MGVNISVGISEFSEIRKNGYYYIDKTGLIEELVRNSGAKVTLITRPRRFGKTMAMNMLAEFFDIRKDSRQLFEGLNISKNQDICSGWMNKWPVLFISFKRVDGLNFQDAYAMLRSVVTEICAEHRYILDGDEISEYDRKTLENIIDQSASVTEIKNSIMSLTRAMEIYYGKPVILIMDEYDVPVAKAESNGYYAEMLDIMKGIMQSLKDNQALRFAVVTGCLKIAKESIFTGTNNFVSDTISHSRLNEYFGFTQNEVDRLLEDTGTTAHADDIREWYDGYRFGNIDIYCPWDVMNYVRDLQYDPSARPAGYWKNTSDNAIIRSFIEHSGASVTKKLETLLSGGYIMQRLDEDLTYDYLHSFEDNLWSIMYLTGYLTKIKDELVQENIPAGMSALKIPNAEIKEIFQTTIMKWFDDSARAWNRQKLFDAVWNADSEQLTAEMTTLLRKTISYHDYKEDFYHAFLAGIFAGAGYIVESNKEHGEGRSDVVVSDTINARIAIFEVKYSTALEKMSAACDAALRQIDERMYAEEYKDEYDSIIFYGVSFFKKRCMVKVK